MDPLFWASAAFLASAAIAWSRRPRALLPAWSDFRETQISPGMWIIEGRVSGLAVRAAVVRGLERSECNLEVDASSLLDPAWRFSANLRTGKVWTHLDARALPIFWGSDPAIRDDQHLEIRGGIAELPLRSRGDAQEVHRAALQIVRVIERLASVLRAEALEESFHSEESVFERERAVLLLAGLHPRHSITSRLLEACIDSGEPLLELSAARHLEGERKRALLWHLVEGDHAFDGVRAEALSLMHPFLDAPSAQSIAFRILDGPPSLSRRAAIRLLAEFPPPEAPERLVEIAQHVQHLATAVELVSTLSIIGGRRAVRGLEHLLGFAGVQKGALAALARLGDRESLTAIYDHRELLDRGDLREATARAVRQIRDRLGGPEHGRLSVVEPLPAGEISLAEHSGELALPEE